MHLLTGAKPEFRSKFKKDLWTKKFPAWIVQYKLNTQLHVAGRFWFTKSKVIHKLFKKKTFLLSSYKENWDI